MLFRSTDQVDGLATTEDGPRPRQFNSDRRPQAIGTWSWTSEAEVGRSKQGSESFVPPRKASLSQENPAETRTHVARPGTFGDFDVRIDPWQIEYGSELPIDARPEDGPEAVDLDVEASPAEWRPISPGEQPHPTTLFFVDGVRCVEARLIVRRGDRLCHGALGSFGVGAVQISGEYASWAAEQIGRLAVLGSGERFRHSVQLDRSLTYLPVSAVGDEPDAPLLEIHGEMRTAEERLARALAEQPDTVVIVDGPLLSGESARGQTVGFVKRLFRMYVPNELLHVLRQLTVGTRSPVFAIRRSGRFSRFSWFVRLADPLLIDADLTGLARLEVSDVIGFDNARRLADATSRLLPRYVPSRARDPRAPQNLMPIGALEAHLRHRLGDTQIIRRRLATLIAQESRHV